MAWPVPITAGTPSSRLTIAAWLLRPPWSVTIAAAFFMTGTQSGLVADATRISPAWKEPASAALRSRRTVPRAMVLPMARPSASTRGFSLQGFSRELRKVMVAARDCTVSGRAWSRNISRVSPSTPHSMSIGRP